MQKKYLKKMKKLNIYNIYCSLYSFLLFKF
jgi:hypothetical protein